MLTPSVRGDLSLDGESENGGPKCNDVCAHRLECGVVGRKNPGLELALGIDEDGEAEGSLANPMREKRLQKNRKAKPAPSGAAQEGYWRKRQMRRRDEWPNFRRGYPDAFIHDAVDPRVTLCRVMGTLALSGWTHMDTDGQ